MTNEEYLKHKLQIMTQNSVYGLQNQIIRLGDPLLSEPDEEPIDTCELLNLLNSIAQDRRTYKIAFNHERREP
jgi:uncharacterized UBP type Zn finger protein